MATESELQWALLKAAPAAIPHLRLFRRNVGTVRVQNRTMRFGVAGQADLYGVFRGGLHLELELKAAGGRLSPEQRAWQAFCLSWKVPHVLLVGGASETTDQTVERWIAEIRECELKFTRPEREVLVK